MCRDVRGRKARAARVLLFRKVPMPVSGFFIAAHLMRTGVLFGLAAAVNIWAGAVATAQGLDKVTFATNWVAEGEHGGFYQAVADGTYKKYGLDVTIVPGGPNENNRMLLIVGRLDFFMAANTLMSFDAVANNVPVVTVAAIFQKDPPVLLTHPEFKITKLEELN